MKSTKIPKDARSIKYSIIDEYGRNVSIKVDEALKLLGREKFLDAVSRCVIHRYAEEISEDGRRMVYLVKKGN